MSYGNPLDSSGFGAIQEDQERTGEDTKTHRFPFRWHTSAHMTHLRRPLPPPENGSPCEASISFSFRPFHRFPIYCFVTYHAGFFLKVPQACCLGFGFLISLLVLNVGSAYAEWMAVASSESSGGYTVYVDPDTIRHEADGVEMWELYDYKKRGTTGGFSFLSFKKLNEYNCGEERIRTLAVMYHSGNMGNGMVVSTNSEKGKWKRVPAGSVGEALWKFACSNK